MKAVNRMLIVAAAASVALAGAAQAEGPSAPLEIAQAKNPCAAKNPCGAKNPCAAKNPCGASNPCAAGAKVDPKLVTRPKGTKLAEAPRAELLKEGERLWKDTKLSTNGVACQTCHVNNAAFNPTFGKPYPHPVAMPKDRAGLKQVNTDEMVQFCLLVPMMSKPLPWDSRELAALTAYTREVQKTFKPGAAAPANPCAAKNPCGAKNPCAPKK
jgi:cytochrome c